MEKVTDPADPRRCQAVFANGQCINKAVDGVNYCEMHGANRGVASNQKRGLRNFILARHHARFSDLADNDAIKSLRDEIAITRGLLEIRLNSITSDMELVLQSGAISDMILKIEKLVTSCNKLEGNLGVMLDKQKLVQFVDTIINILKEEITDLELINKVTDRIVASLSSEG